MSKPNLDWTAIEAHYRAGIRSLKHIGDEYGVSDAGIIKRARRDCWTRCSIPASAKKHCVVLKTKDELDSSGFLYVIFIDTGLERLFKIGMSRQFSSRLDAHQCASPFEIKVALCYFTGSMRAEERRLHALYANHRVRGEWFALFDADLVDIAQGALLV